MSMQSLADLIAEQPDRPQTVVHRPIRSPRRAAAWGAAIHRAYSYVSSRIADPAQQAGLDSFCEKTLSDGPDFLKVRSTAEFKSVPVAAYNRDTAAEIMRQARSIERETYASRGKGEHGGGLGRMGIQLLEWFCFTMWPNARRGIYPSLAYIATGARMSRQAVVDALKRLKAFGFLEVAPRRKRIETPLGVKQVQDTSSYTLTLAKGLGALALRVFGKKPQAAGGQKAAQASESTKTPAKENPVIYSFLAGENSGFSPGSRSG